MILTPPDLAILVTNVAFQQKDVAFAVAMAESGGRTDARNHVNNPGSPANGSWDRGLYQLNSYWFKQFSDEECDDPLRCAELAAWISKGGTNWGLWTTFNHGSHLKYISLAQQHLAQVLE